MPAIGQRRARSNDRAKTDHVYPPVNGTTAQRKRDRAMTPKPISTLITVVGTLAYLGLAILGWGGFAAFFSHPALVALAIVFFVLFGIALFTDSNLNPGVRQDPADHWVLLAFWLIGLLAAYLPAYTDRKGFWILDVDA